MVEVNERHGVVQVDLRVRGHEAHFRLTAKEFVQMRDALASIYLAKELDEMLEAQRRDREEYDNSFRHLLDPITIDLDKCPG